MFYSDELIEEIRQENDVVDVISTYVKLKRSGSNYVGLCPFHNEKTPSFSVSQNKQMYYCFGCGVGGNVITFIMEYENYSFLEAIKVLAERVGKALPEAGNSAEYKKQTDLKSKILELNKLAAQYYYYQFKNQNGQVAYQYLTDRQLSEDTIKHFGLGYSNKFSDDLYQYIKEKGYSDELLKETGLFTYDEKKGVYDKFWNRVMFPIMDMNHRVIGFGGRVMGEGMPKYLNSPETKVFDKSRNLYGLNFARTSRKKGMIICEGYMDVIALHQAGFENAVASLGTAFTGLQANLLKRYTEQVYLSYDSDEAGVKAALRAIPILKEAGLAVKVINMRPYKDPDEFIKALGKEEYQKRMDEAENSFYYEISILEKNYNFNDPEEKTKFCNEVAKKLLSFQEELERNNYTEAIARKYGFRYEDLKKLVNHHGAKMIGAVIKENKEEQTRKKNVSKEDGFKKSQKMLLTWMIDDIGLFKKLEGVISPDDFKEEPYKTVAQMLFEQYEKENNVFPAKIISNFMSKEEQSEVAGIFNTNLITELSGKEREKALNDIVIKIKKYSLDYASRHVSDINELQNIIKEQTKLQKLHISL